MIEAVDNLITPNKRTISNQNSRITIPEGLNDALRRGGRGRSKIDGIQHVHAILSHAL
jgi:hypothetical protein